LIAVTLFLPVVVSAWWEVSRMWEIGTFCANTTSCSAKQEWEAVSWLHDRGMMAFVWGTNVVVACISGGSAYGLAQIPYFNVEEEWKSSWLAWCTVVIMWDFTLVYFLEKILIPMIYPKLMDASIAGSWLQLLFVCVAFMVRYIPLYPADMFNPTYEERITWGISVTSIFGELFLFTWGMFFIKLAVSVKRSSGYTNSQLIKCDFLWAPPGKPFKADSTMRRSISAGTTRQHSLTVVSETAARVPTIDARVLVFHLGMLGATFNPYTPLLSIAFLMLFSAYEYIRSRSFDPLICTAYELCPAAMLANTIVQLGVLCICLIPLRDDFKYALVPLGFVLCVWALCLQARLTRYHQKAISHHLGNGGAFDAETPPSLNAFLCCVVPVVEDKT